MKRLITTKFNGQEVRMKEGYDFYIPHGYLKVIARNLGVSEHKIVNLRKGRICNSGLKNEVINELNRLLNH